MELIDSKRYSWKWVTVNSILCRTPCEVCAVILTSDGTESVATLYNGVDGSGEVIAIVRALGNRSCPFNIHHHIYCSKGLYVDVKTDAHVTGMFVQWLEQPQGVGD